MSQLTDRELENLLYTKESERVERCESAQDKDKIAKAICAFANDMEDSRKSGVIFIGVKNKGECAGLSVTDEMLLNVSNIRSDGNLQPFPVMSVCEITLRKCEMIVVEVQPSQNPPMRYNGRC